MRKRIWILSLVFCLLLGACGGEPPAENSPTPSPGNSGTAEIPGDKGPQASGTPSDAPAEEALSQLLFPREEIREVYVLLDRRLSGAILAPTNEAEKEAILDQLYAVDISEFADTEQTGMLGAAISLTLRSEDGEKTLHITSGDGWQRLDIQTQSDQLSRLGPADAFDSQALNQLVLDVLANKEDPDFSGELSVAGTERPGKVNKGNCAYARFLLDTALTKAEAEQPTEELACDVTLRVGDTVYGIDSGTGGFYREDAHGKQYARIDGQDLMELKIWLGIRTAAGEEG